MLWLIILILIVAVMCKRYEKFIPAPDPTKIPLTKSEFEKYYFGPVNDVKSNEYFKYW